MAYQPFLFPALEDRSPAVPSPSPFPQDGLGVLPVLSTYSGGGLMDLGFAQAGLHPVLVIEAVGAFAWAYAEAALPLYRDYCPGCPSQVLQADITQLSGREILSTMEGLAPANPFGVPVVGVLGGPPCQDFSVAGKNQGVAGERGRHGLAKTRGPGRAPGRSARLLGQGVGGAAEAPGALGPGHV